ncbi:MAG: aminoglycoside phosphotransferase family protein [Acidimicrobiales bacterium]|nr:aminoglycoside phosphotransferase family protein [Acidimicrobiales bacterium]
MTDTFAMARARRALSEAGLNYQMPLERASSVTNEVWLSPEYVIRVNRQPNQRLRREALIGPALPPSVNYPEVVAYGGQLGADWLIARRQPGNVLSRCWPSMSIEERREAVRQFANILRNLHQVTAPPDLPEIATPQLLDGRRFHTTEPLLEALEKAETFQHVDRGFIAEIRRIVEDLAPSIEPFNVPTLIHGDLHFENVLWDNLHITALLDFEYARAGPPDLDLDVFLRFCAYPFLHVAEDYEHLTRAEDYAPIPYWLADDYPELFATPKLFERTQLYSIAYDVRELLQFPPARPPRELSRYHPYNRLELVVRGTSHLHRLAGRLAFDAMSYEALVTPTIPYVAYDAVPPLARSSEA